MTKILLIFKILKFRTYPYNRCIALLSLCLSTKQQYNFSLNNFQYYLIKLSLLILLQISLQLNDGSSQLTVCIATTNTIGIINVSCSISIIICINIHLNVRFSTLRRTFILCLSTKQQYNFSLNNFQYYLIKLSLLILLQISLQLNDGSSQLMVLIPNKIDIIVCMTSS